MVNKKEKETITVKGWEMLRRKPKLYGEATSCVVYLPKEWEGKEVIIVRVD